MRRHYLYLARRFFSRPQGESSPLIKHLDVHISSETALPRAGKSKLKRNLDAQSLPELTTSQLGALQSAEEEILETLEECLQSNSMLGAFPNFKHSSQLIQISKVKVNRDLSHVDVIWGSQILEGFINRIYETSGKAEGKRMKDKIFKKTNLQLQKKEGTFRTFLMRAIEFRRVPRIFFRPPEEITSNDENVSSFNDWRKEQLVKQQKLKEWAEVHEEKDQVASPSANKDVEEEADNDSGDSESDLSSNSSSDSSDSESEEGSKSESESGSEESSSDESSSDENSDDKKSETE